MIKRVVVWILINALGMFALAQTPASSPVRYNELQVYLQLSDDQLQSLRQIQQRQDADLQPIYQQIADKRVEVRQLLGSGSTDAAQIGQLEIEIVSLRKALSIASRPYRQQSFAILTADQQQMLPQLVNSLLLKRLASEAVSLRLIDNPNILGAVNP